MKGPGARRTARLAICVAVAATAAPQPAWAAAETTVERFHVDFGIFVEQQPHCVHEPIEWTGGYDLVVTTTYTPAGATRSLNYTQAMTGVGVISGSAFRLSAHYHELVRAGAGAATVSVTPLSYVQISANGSNYVFKSVRRQIVTPTGVTVVDSELDAHDVSLCVG